MHINEHGEVIDSEEQRTYIDYKSIGPKLIPAIPKPYSRTLVLLCQLWEAIKTSSQHNSGAALFTFGAMAMNLHFQSVVNEKAVPVWRARRWQNHNCQCSKECAGNLRKHIQGRKQGVHHSFGLEDLHWGNVRQPQQGASGKPHCRHLQPRKQRGVQARC